MNWFNNWFAKKCQQAWQENQPKVALSTNSVHRTFDSDSGINMTLYKAIGGRIVVFNRYNEKIDRSARTTYIITDEQDFERELSKIITLESMKQ